MQPSVIDLIALFLFGIAVLHTFLIRYFEHIASFFPSGSIGENFFRFMGEVEIIFGLWAGVLIMSLVIIQGPQKAFQYVEGLKFTEPVFVFVIMAVSATRPIISITKRIILWLAKLLPLPQEVAVYLSCLLLGPLLGSFITEPAAMTVTAVILRDRYFSAKVSQKFKYLTLGILLVNVSIGGVLTPFAAPPVLMVASKWNFAFKSMLSTFGWKAAIATLFNSCLFSWILRKELQNLSNLNSVAKTSKHENQTPTKNEPLWLAAIHILFLTFIILTSHHLVIFVGLFLFFIGIATITKIYQDDLKLRECFLVAFFLSGLVVLGGLQNWWLEPLLHSLDAFPLYLGTTALTAITDNAALTFLGSQVEGVTETFKYSLVAGAITGGGLTVIANAPNPVGFAILQDYFGTDRIDPLKLLLAASIPTIIAGCCFWLLPSF